MCVSEFNENRPSFKISGFQSLIPLLNYFPYRYFRFRGQANRKQLYIRRDNQTAR